MTVDYDVSWGIVFSALRFKSTVIPLVMLKPEFFLLLALNLSITYAHKSGFFIPQDYNVGLAMKLTSVTGGLMTFFVVFYNGNVFARYNKLYDLTKGMNENCLYVVSILDKELKGNPKNRMLVRRLTKLMLASCFIFFFERTPGEDDGEGGFCCVANEEWAQLRSLDLLTETEVAILTKHCQDMGKDAMPSFMLLQWSMKIYRTAIPRLGDLDKAYYAVRKCQEDVVESLEMPMPFQYFHIMNLMLMLNLTLWAYALALEESYFASVIYLFVQLMFQGLRELSIALADPYGDDDTDFPLNDWMTAVYLRLSSVLEDPHDIKDSTPTGFVSPLPELPEGMSVVDLLDANNGQIADTLGEQLAAKEHEAAMNKRKSEHGGRKSHHHHHHHTPGHEDEEEEDDDEDDGE